MVAAVRANAALGARCIKVVATGGVLTMGLDPREAAYTQAELDRWGKVVKAAGITAN